MSCSVTLKNISASIGAKCLFKGLNLYLGHKEKIAIIGPNGCGKSTLLQIIGGLYEADSGQIELFHEPMKSLKDFNKIRPLLGYLFQNSDDQFIAPTVLADTAFGLLASGHNHAEAVKRAEFILNELGILELKDEIVFYLSGGQKKLVALAGVLASEPKILLLDEPTSALDVAFQARLAQILSSLDIAQIIVSHDENFISQITDKIYYLSPDGLSQKLR